MFPPRIFFRKFSEFVPLHEPPHKADKKKFLNFLSNHNNIVVLTGAGVSTESGIPDYRSEGKGMFNRSNYKPMDYSTFIGSKDARVRYWARNYLGWPQFQSKIPNRTHMELVRYEVGYKKILGIITQNVDGLHNKAGSENVIDLHGNAFWVQCLSCKHLIWRQDFQKILQQMNPGISESENYSLRPDGDIEISEDIYKVFQAPDCEKCGGILKPTIVFFGDNIPVKRVKNVEQWIEKSDALLIMGTTLSTFSSSRIFLQAYDLCKYICIVNIGPTKYDNKADLVIHCNCSDIFPEFTVR